jgi:hypothetical protein
MDGRVKPGQDKEIDRLKHDPEKCVAVFRSCANDN